MKLEENLKVTLQVDLLIDSETADKMRFASDYIAHFGAQFVLDSLYIAGRVPTTRIFAPGTRVKMISCLISEPSPSESAEDLEEWINPGGSARPIQTHIGDIGRVLDTYQEGFLHILFDDGDDRFLYLEELVELPKEKRIG